MAQAILWAFSVLVAVGIGYALFIEPVVADRQKHKRKMRADLRDVAIWKYGHAIKIK